MASAKSGGTDQIAPETTPNSTSNWKAVLASVGIFAEALDGEKNASNLPSANRAPGSASSVKKGPALVVGSPSFQLSTAARLNSGASQSVNINQARVPDLALPANTGMVESGAILPDQKTQAKSDPENALHRNKNKKSESGGARETVVIFNPAAAAISAAMSGQGQFVSSSFATLAKGGDTVSANLHSSVPETRSLQSFVNRMESDKTPDEMKNEPPQSTQPVHSASFIDASPSLEPAQHQPANTSLKSAAVMQQASSSASVAPAYPESLRPVDAIVPAADGAEVELNTAKDVPLAAENHLASAVGSAARQAPPLARRGDEAAFETAHAANQPSPAVQEQSLLPIHETAGVQMTPGASGNGNFASASTATSAAISGIHETFAALDGANQGLAPTWIHTGARMAEAGFQDPALGWVGVRAQVDINGVHAALVPGSSDAAQALGVHLAGLNAYLTEHHAGVETLTIGAPESRSNEQGLNHGSGMGEHSGQSANSNGDRAPGATAARRVVADGSNGPAMGSPPGGVYVSVMA